MVINTNIKMIYVLLDGVGDLPNPELNGLTPLEAAYTPALDAFAKNGSIGQVTTVGPNIAPQSDIAVFNMLGYDFQNGGYVGRGVVESIGSGIDFREGDLAMRGNFATLDEAMHIVDRRAGRDISKEEAYCICNTLSEHIKFDDTNASVVIQPTIGHRLVIRFRHDKLSLSDKVTNTDPAYDKICGVGIAKTSSYEDSIAKSIAEEDIPAARISAKLINDFSEQAMRILKNHPVNERRIREKKKSMNCILLRDSGNRYPNLEPMGRKYGFKVGCIVDMPVEVGISKIINIDLLEPGRIDDYQKKARTVAEYIANFNLIYVHIKGPDEFGHDGDAHGKRKNIEDIDKNFFAKLLDETIAKEFGMVVSADHCTPCIKKSHSSDPVPLLISGRKVIKDIGIRFTEKDASKGTIGNINGVDVIRTAVRMIAS